MVLSPASLETIRQVAIDRLEKLQEDALINKPVSWVNGAVLPDTDSLTERAKFFHATGFVHIPNFVDHASCQAMKDEMAVLVQTKWHPPRGNETDNSTSQRLDSFGTNDAQNVQRGDYFLESADRVHFFAEPDALESDTTNGTTPRLKPMYHTDKLAALNKAGHGLHLLPHSSFQHYTRSSALRETVLELGWVDPVVPQSMYIFKQASIGGAVHSHQDSTFLYTTPRQTCLGLWLALDDATLTNGCLWVRPCSHWTDQASTDNGTDASTDPRSNVTRRQYQRNEQHFGPKAIAARSNHAMGNVLQPTFAMRQLVTDPNVPWDGGLPTGSRTDSCDDQAQALLEAGFCPLECQAGDLLLFVGDLDHLSLPNTSSTPRHTFQLHLVEGPSQGIEWSPYNWLQVPPDKPFLRLLDGETNEAETER